MGLTILVIVVLFFLGRKLKGHSWLQAICFTGMLIASIVLCTYYFSLPGAVGFLCGGVLIFLTMLTAPTSSDEESLSMDERLDNLTKSMGSSEGKPDENSPAVDALIDEAVEVINDMLEVGFAARIKSEADYEGFIIYFPTIISFVPRTVGIYIKMVSVSDLRSCRYRHSAYDHIPEYKEEMDKLDRFIEKYSYCYNPQEKAYIYETRKNIPVPYSKKNVPAGKIVNIARLRSEIEQRCPLADFSGVGLHTKNVPHG